MGEMRESWLALKLCALRVEVQMLTLVYDSGIILSARLKALGVESLIVDRHPQPGDNWALRYDCLRFHIGRHNAETPYLRKKCSLQTHSPSLDTEQEKQITMIACP